MIRYLSIIALLLLVGCDPVQTVHFKNNSDKKLYIETSQLYPDDNAGHLKIDTIRSKQLALDNNLHEDSIRSKIITSLRPRFDTCSPHSTQIIMSVLGFNGVEQAIKEENRFNTLSAFVFDARLIDSLGWQQAIQKNAYLKVITATVDDLKKSGFTITY